MTQGDLTTKLPPRLVPRMIQELGPAAADSYQRFFAKPTWNPKTRKLYLQHLGRFDRWLESHELRLDTVSARQDYREELTANYSRHQASMFLTPVRALFHCLIASGSHSENPFETQAISSTDQTAGSTTSPSTFTGQVRTQTEETADSGFPLLTVMAILAHMDEESLQRVFTEGKAAMDLLTFARWPDGKQCAHCGVILEEPDDGQAAIDGCSCCTACGRAISLTGGSVFEDSPIPLPYALSAVFSFCIGQGNTPQVEDWAQKRGLESSAVSSLVSSIQACLASKGLSEPDALRHALEEQDRDLQQREAIRGIVRYAGLMDARDQLVRAQTEGTSIDDLPAGMSIAQALDRIQSEIETMDRYVLVLEDGRVMRRLATPAELQPQTMIPEMNGTPPVLSAKN